WRVAEAAVSAARSRLKRIDGDVQRNAAQTAALRAEADPAAHLAAAEAALASASAARADAQAARAAIADQREALVAARDATANALATARADLA
ncbi:hypothetical protein ABTM18_19490, partial [Acinetobacter baumannii]